MRTRGVILFLLILSLLLTIDSGCGPQSEKGTNTSTIPITTLYAAKQRNEYGVNLMNEGKYVEAIAEFTKAIDICPKFTELYCNRGAANCQINEFEKAIEDYTEAIRLDSMCDQAYNGRGYAYAGLNEYNKAIIDYTDAISMQPMNAEYFYNRGCVYKAIDNEQEASADLHKCIELSRDPALTQKARQILLGL